jgi:hypothetical protein
MYTVCELQCLLAEELFYQLVTLIRSKDIALHTVVVSATVSTMKYRGCSAGGKLDSVPVSRLYELDFLMFGYRPGDYPSHNSSTLQQL